MGAAAGMEVEQKRGGNPKVVFVLGAERFHGEVINSDKIQVYAGLPVMTNKVTEEECAGVPHHLLSCITCPDADFTADDFCREAAATIKGVLSRGGLPVVAGGSNRYIEALVDGNGGAFRSTHDCLFVWLDAAPDVLRRCTAVRVDDMVRRGLVEEARAVFDPDAGYDKGLRRAIGLPEMDAYLRRPQHDDEDGDAMLKRAVEEIKDNTFGLVQVQVEKIQRLKTLDGWDVRRVDCTEVLALMADGEGVEQPWREVVWEPVQAMVSIFLEEDAIGIKLEN